MPSAPTLEQLAAKKHPEGSIFNAFPAIGTAVVDGTTTAIPYHNYDSELVIIWGSASAEWVQERLVGPWKPLLGKDGRAQVALYVFDYKDTVVNPYKELILVFSTVHASKSVAPISFAHQQLQLFDDKVAYPYVYKLWLSEQLPVTYGRELLGCDKYLDPAMKVDFGNGGVSFEFHHVGKEVNAPPAGPLLSGKLKLKADNMHLMSLVGAYGLCRTLGMWRPRGDDVLAAGATNSWHVVTPPGVMKTPNSKDYNPVWDYVFQTSPKFTTASEADDLVYGGELKAMGFKAELYQHDPHLRAVLTAPWTMVPVMNDEKQPLEPTKADSESKSKSKVGLFSPKSKSKSKKSLV